MRAGARPEPRWCSSCTPTRVFRSAGPTRCATALAAPGVAGGAFRLRFDDGSLAMRIVEWGAHRRAAVRRAAVRRPGALRAAPRARSDRRDRAGPDRRGSRPGARPARHGRLALLPLAVSTSARRYQATRRAAHLGAQRRRARGVATRRRPRSHRALGARVERGHGAGPKLRAPAMPSSAPGRDSWSTCAATALRYAARRRRDARLRRRLHGGADAGRLGDGGRRAGTRPSRGGAALRLARAATLVRGALRYVSRTQLFNLAREIEYEMRNDLFAHLQRLPQSFFQRWRTGDLMSRCVNDLGSVRLMLGPGALSLLQTPVLFLFVIGAMFSLNPALAAAGAGAVPALPVRRARLRRDHAPLESRRAGGARRALEPAPGVDRRRLRW